MADKTVWNNRPISPVGHVLLAVFMILQIGLSFFLYNPQWIWLTNIGWVVFFISALLGWLPTYEFKRKGGVGKGESYMKTTKLVDTGIYGIVRHPQFVAGILIAFALPLITQSWIIVLLGIPNFIFFYLGLIEGDQRGIKKFGDEYKKYMKRVPKANFVLGIIGYLQRKK